LILGAFCNGRLKVTTPSYNNAAKVRGVCGCHELGILISQERFRPVLVHPLPAVCFEES